MLYFEFETVLKFYNLVARLLTNENQHQVCRTEPTEKIKILIEQYLFDLEFL